MVSFIGAGPGDPELLTIKGKRLISPFPAIGPPFSYLDCLIGPQ